MVPFNLNVLAKFGLGSKWPQKLDEPSLAHACCQAQFLVNDKTEKRVMDVSEAQ